MTNATNAIDKSRKNSYDTDIEKLIDRINSFAKLYMTTSSCSGRIVIYQKTQSQKKNCIWLFTTHQYCNANDFWNAIHKTEGYTCIKFEPFILHCQCFTLEAATKLLTAGVSSGFRESGISIGKNQRKIMVAIRSSQNMDIPLCDEDGKLLVSTEYVEFILKILHQKMTKNAEKRQRFECQLEIALSSLSEEDSKSNLKKSARQRQVNKTENKSVRTDSSNDDNLDFIEEMFCDQR